MSARILDGKSLAQKIRRDVEAFVSDCVSSLREQTAQLCGDMLESIRTSDLKEQIELDVRLALPGHKALITDWRGRLEELMEHHVARLNLTMTAVEHESTVYEASLKVFNSGAFSASPADDTIEKA